jgi:hypothetical protein
MPVVRFCVALTAAFFDPSLPESQRRDEWHVIAVDGRNDMLVATHFAAGSAVRFGYGPPQWTPDGKRLAAVREEARAPSIFTSAAALATVRPTGGDERVTFTFPSLPSEFSTYYAGDFSWQPR